MSCRARLRRSAPGVYSVYCDGTATELSVVLRYAGGRPRWRVVRRGIAIDPGGYLRRRDALAFIEAHFSVLSR